MTLPPPRFRSPLAPAKTFPKRLLLPCLFLYALPICLADDFSVSINVSQVFWSGPKSDAPDINQISRVGLVDPLTGNSTRLDRDQSTRGSFYGWKQTIYDLLYIPAAERKLWVNFTRSQSTGHIVPLAEVIKGTLNDTSQNSITLTPSSSQRIDFAWYDSPTLFQDLVGAGNRIMHRLEKASTGQEAMAIFSTFYDTLDTASTVAPNAAAYRFSRLYTDGLSALIGKADYTPSLKSKLWQWLTRCEHLVSKEELQTLVASIFRACAEAPDPAWRKFAAAYFYQKLQAHHLQFSDGRDDLWDALHSDPETREAALVFALAVIRDILPNENERHIFWITNAVTSATSLENANPAMLEELSQLIEARIGIARHAEPETLRQKLSDLKQYSNNIENL